MTGGAPRQTIGPEAIADFMRDLREGVEAGADPLSAAQGAAASLPARFRNAIEAIVARLRGRHHEDEWGFDEQLAEALFGLFELVYDLLWRGEIEGVRNVPAHGGALLVADRAGSAAPFDAAMITTAIMKRHPLPRWPRCMVDRGAFALPVLSSMVRCCGAVPASTENTIELLRRGELVTVFGDSGFASLAARARVPIVPVIVVGAPHRRIEFRAPIDHLTGAAGYDRDDGVDGDGDRQ
jgi:hypothetical protein